MKPTLQVNVTCRGDLVHGTAGISEPQLQLMATDLLQAAADRSWLLDVVGSFQAAASVEKLRNFVQQNVSSALELSSSMLLASVSVH